VLARPLGVSPAVANVQVISAEQWLDFLARRRLSRISSPSCGAGPMIELQTGVVLR
jgi:hypothetical protein